VQGRLLLKAGAIVSRPAPAGWVILMTLRQLAWNLQVDLTITSGEEGQHSGPFDPHKLGEAYDVRSHGLSAPLQATILHELHARLGPRFYAFLEAPGQPNEHFHIQRAKDTTFTVADFFAWASPTA
jgi:hypothetical protein